MARANRGEQDNPNVIVLPPLLYGIFLLVSLLLNWLQPLPLSSSYSALLWSGLALIILGIALALWGKRALDAADTNVNPNLPTTSIVTGGPFRFSRNPLYLALTLIYIGLSLLLNSWWGFLLLLPLLLLMHFGVVLREERYLQHKFGDRYCSYRQRVRRYF